MPTHNSTATMGYAFSDAEVSLLSKRLADFGMEEKIRANITFDSASGYAGAVIKVERSPNAELTPMVQLQSAPSDKGRVLFCALSFGDNQLLGPEKAYATLDEATRYAIQFVRTVFIVDKRNLEQTTKKNEYSKNAIDSKVLQAWEIQYVQSYATRIGDAAHEAGWANFTENVIADSLFISLGYLYKGQPVRLGSVVVTLDESGETLCSVRGVDATSSMPGPQYYASVSEALTTAWKYFEFMAITTSQHNKRPWWKRIF